MTINRLSSRRTWSTASLLAVEFVCLFLIVLVGFNVFSTMELQKARKRLRLVQAELEQRNDVLQRKRDGLAQVARDKQLILEVLRSCRTVDDIPNFDDSPFLAAIMRSGTNHDAVFYVPNARSRLNVEINWKSLESADDDSGMENSHQTWDVALVPNSGYIVSIPIDSKRIASHWTIEGNSPQSKLQSIPLPLSDFQPRSWSWSTDKQFARWPLTDKMQLEDGLQVMKISMSGPAGEKQYSLTMTARVVVERETQTDATSQSE
ncbi:MAG: hypothetical protein KDA87_05945 [Planctomycetales bacterium]|nr:hypothetical protein [Planctomycetales bacterium]